ncbi:DUF4810 domain-containing protein [Pseudoalteromonas sp. S16_S37]|uniref:DUF4810 domain-containing protein n=1 Tax=Pseudoalteromonas sp. S16_S37 TaxID=2720228 RepID=UPI00168166B9|nr:DUF4810 domain-containing protein [Pseudoalteromonas sp. S16_S37]MBD1582438.1 DUF4810 domain-containing protein [Pseudoalteromonas sp. S16_S37]
MNKLILFTALLCVILLSGCESSKPLYYYGTYSQNLYDYFKADEVSISEQINTLERTVQTAKNRGVAIAPGIMAHLGYLYLLEGNTVQGFNYLEQEKRDYPESEHYINFLISNTKGEVQ